MPLLGDGIALVGILIEGEDKGKLCYQDGKGGQWKLLSDLTAEPDEIKPDETNQ